ncbi:MAG: ArsR family transcriptional regulator [Verrucomicrobia bacterium]|nr:ArsR family transcriptional regulator [Verrucomicrobiota bacterium]
MVSFFLDAAELLGVPKSVAAIYGVVFASPNPLSFTDIEQRLDISKGSISQGLRVLREVGAVKAVEREGDRRERFVPDLELRKLIRRWLEERLQKQLTAGNNKLTALKQLVPTQTGENAEVLRQRLKQLQAWHSKARAVVPLAKTFLQLT